MPQEPDPYPIELTTEDDPDWAYLRKKILRSVNWQSSQAGCSLTLGRRS